jgi:hypothetical protein
MTALTVESNPVSLMCAPTAAFPLPQAGSSGTPSPKAKVRTYIYGVPGSVNAVARCWGAATALVGEGSQRRSDHRTESHHQSLSKVLNRLTELILASTTM